MVADVADNPDASDQRARDGAAALGMRGHDQADEEFAQSVVKGVESAFAALYDRYCWRAYSLARRICVDEGLAEKVVQEVFLAFWREPRRYDPHRGSFCTWILAVVHHKSVDVVRREAAIRRRTVPAAEEGKERPADTGPGADQGALLAVEAGHVRDALSGLPPDQRQALALAYFGGYTQREVAAITGVPLGTVKSRMFNGVQRLRSVLGPVLGDVSADLPGGAR